MPTLVAASKTVTGSSSSLNHTAGAGSNMLAIVDVAWFDNAEPTIVTATYNSVGMTLVRTDHHPNESRIQTARYYYKAPANSSLAVAVAFSATPALRYMYVHTWSDVDQTTPLGTTAYGASNTAGPATVDASSAASEAVADFLFALGSAVAVGAGQAVLNAGASLDDDDPGGNGFSLGASQEAGAATTTMSWTLTGASLWAIYASPIKPASGGASGVPRFMNFRMLQGNN